MEKEIKKIKEAIIALATLIAYNEAREIRDQKNKDIDERSEFNFLEYVDMIVDEIKRILK